MRRDVYSVIRNAALVGIAVAVLVAYDSGCGGSSPLDLPNSGKSLMSVPGQMSFDVECIAHLEPSGPFLEISWAIPPISLAFVKQGEGFIAQVEASVRLHRPENGEMIDEISWRDTTAVRSYARTRSVVPFEGSRRVSVPSGLWIVETVMEDVQSGSRAARSQAIRVPDTMVAVPQVGGIFLEWRHPDGRFAPFVMFHVPSGLDSMRAAIQVFHLDRARPAFARVLFERFICDTTVPLPPYAYLITTNQFSRYSPVDFSNVDTVAAADVALHPTDPETDFAFPIPAVRPGIFRITALVRASGPAGDTILALKRTVSIKGETFPRPSTLTELVDALEYIAKPEEVKGIRASGTATEERDRFDLFWLARTGDRETASGLLRAYYNRVEEANRYFSVAKEGWKTDRGMIYIVLGPPAEISTMPQGQTWTYNFPGNYGASPFVFRRISLHEEGIAFDEYVLMRQPEYEIVWDGVVARWRRGESFW